MKSETVPLAMPKKLLGEVRKAARKTGLSTADAMRQSMKLGLPKLVEQLSPGKLTPMTAEERRRTYGSRNEEFDALEHHCAALPKTTPEDD